MIMWSYRLSQRAIAVLVFLFLHILDLCSEVKIKTSEGFAIVKEGRRSHETTKEDESVVNSSEYGKIFRNQTREGELIKRVICYGKGGVGKSTFVEKVAYDWAIESSIVLKAYTLVFLLKMCLLDQTSDLIEAIFDQLLGEDSGVEKGALERFIMRSPDEILILLDGFDELKTTILSEDSYGSILKALNRKRYRECCICVTVRDSHLDNLMTKSLIQNPCIHAEVLGFTHQTISEYAENFFGEDPDSAKALMERIEDSDTISDLAKNPMILLFMCLIYRGDKQMPETTSRFYKECIDYMFKRKDIVSEEQKSKVVLSIGQVALRGLLSDERKVAFCKDDFETNSLEVAVKAGILTSQRSFTSLMPHNIVQFFHETMQEYCAAKYWQSLHKSNFRRMQRLLIKLGLKKGRFHDILEAVCSAEQQHSRFHNLLSFCCSDSKPCMESILKYKVKLSEENSVDETLNLEMLSYYYEGQSHETPPTSLINSLVNSPTWFCFDNTQFLRLVFFLQDVFGSENGQVCLATVESIHFSNIVAPNSLAFAMCKMRSLETLELTQCQLSAEDMKHMLSSLKNNDLLREIHLTRNDKLSRTAITWAPYLKQLTNLQTLCLVDSNLQGEDIEHITLPLNESAVTELDLSDNRALGGTARLWAPHLRNMKQILRLALRDCALLPDDVKFISLSLFHMVSLTDLELSYNKGLGGSANVWSQYLSLMKRLLGLVLSDCSLQCTDIAHIAESLHGMRNLTDLSLSGNFALGGSANMWALCLPRMRFLKRLALSCCSLRQDDYEHIALSVSKMDNLKGLSLTCNKTVGLKNTKTLRKMKRCLVLFWTDGAHS